MWCVVALAMLWPFWTSAVLLLAGIKTLCVWRLLGRRTVTVVLYFVSVVVLLQCGPVALARGRGKAFLDRTHLIERWRRGSSWW